MSRGGGFCYGRWINCFSTFGALLGAVAAAGPSIFSRLTYGAAKGLHTAGIAARLGMIERLRLTSEGDSHTDMKCQTGCGTRPWERYSC